VCGRRGAMKYAAAAAVTSATEVSAAKAVAVEQASTVRPATAGALATVGAASPMLTQRGVCRASQGERRHRGEEES
jgi:hypothetical protein